MAASNPLIVSIDPATGTQVTRLESHAKKQIHEALDLSSHSFQGWRHTDFDSRKRHMNNLAQVLRSRVEPYATLITQEMGKPITQARAEIEKAAGQCEFYAEHAAEFLEAIPAVAGAAKGHVAFEPLGVVLAVMPWNFPFSQVTRFAAPAVMAGNTVLLKHASNVPQCALAIQQAFEDAGFPSGVFQSLLIDASSVLSLIADPRIRAVTVTGSSEAGAAIAEAAGASLKKTVLELGGSDPFIVLADADVPVAAEAAAKTRLSNSGQACAAGKRFIVHRSIAKEFEELFAKSLSSARVGDPTDPDTEVGPMARADLVETLANQVQQSVLMGARVVVGGRRLPRSGFFYEPTLLADCTSEMPVLREEVFGPVAAMIVVDDDTEAIRIANDTEYGLGATIWTADVDYAKELARQIEAGYVVINGRVISDPRIPFGGIKQSGYGREQSEFGIREFVNIQAVVVGEA